MSGAQPLPFLGIHFFSVSSRARPERTHEHHRHPKFFCQVERFDRQIKALLRRIRAERNDLVVTVRSPLVCIMSPCAGNVGPVEGPRALHEHARGLRHRGIARAIEAARSASIRPPSARAA